VVAADIRRFAVEGFDLVVTNPPFRALRDGNVSPHPERAVAHHELTLTLDGWLAVAARAVRPGGRVAAILPAAREDELLGALPAHGLAPARLRRVHPFADRPASRILVEAALDPRGARREEPPLVVHVAGARYTPEVLQMLGESV